MADSSPAPAAPETFAPLEGVKVLSLALNLPGPATLMRCRQLGARCTKLEAPPPPHAASSDPMGAYNPTAYTTLHEGVDVVFANLKTPDGQATLHELLAQTDVLITSFRPAASAKLGVAWPLLHARHPRLCLVEIVGAPGPRADEPGHDLTYLAESGLVTGTELPPTLFADMGGSLMASEAVMGALLRRSARGEGVHVQVALSEAANYLALPRRWGLTEPTGTVGGAHAGYRVYACADGRVAVAALEPHFAASLCALAGVEPGDGVMFRSATHAAIAAFLKTKRCEELDALARANDVPLHTMAQSDGPPGASVQ